MLRVAIFKQAAGTRVAARVYVFGHWLSALVGMLSLQSQNTQLTCLDYVQLHVASLAASFADLSG